MEITPPPVFPVEIPASERRMPGGWIAFLVIFFLYAGMQFALIFGQPKDKTVSVSAEEIAIKTAVRQEIVGLELRKLSTTSLPQASSLDVLETTEKTLIGKIDQSAEAAALVLTSQLIRGAGLEGRALDKLLLSDDPKFVSLGEAFEGTLTDSQEIKRNDLVGKVAKWKIANPDLTKIPVTETGVKVNTMLFMGFILYLAGVFFIGIVLVGTYIFLKLSHQLPSVGYQSALSLGQSDRHAARLFFYMFLFIMLSLLGATLSQVLKLDEVWTMVGYMFLVVLLIPSIVTLAINGPKFPLKAIWGDTSQPMKKVLWGIGGFMANFPVAIGVLVLMSQFSAYLPTPGHEATEMIAKSSGPGMMIALFLVIAIFAPLIEEPTFRGLLFPALTKVFRSPFWGVAISGIMFAIIHPQGPVVWPSLAVIGISCAILTRQTGSLIPAVVLHFCHNATIVALSVILL